MSCRRACALHQNIWLQRFKGTELSLIGSAEVLHELRFRWLIRAIEHVNLETALRSLPSPATFLAANSPIVVLHAFDVIPSLCDNARGLNEDAEATKCLLDLYCKLGLDAKALRAEAMPVLDARR